MDGVAQLNSAERGELFTETAARMGVLPIIAEKDFWVCWSLKHLFASPDQKPALLFKGGTSLSKVFHVINRFSEDIDLSLDRLDLGFTGDRDPLNAGSYAKAGALVQEIEAACIRHIADVLLPALQSKFTAVIGADEGNWRLTVDEGDSQTANFDYPRGFPTAEYKKFGYVRPTVRLEIGARSDHWPADRHPVKPYAAEFFPNQFRAPSCNVRTLGAERTFWEKVTLLHAEYHRPQGRHLRPWLARHYYDVAMLGGNEIKQRAIAQPDLLARVVTHKDWLFHSAWANYGEATPGTLRLAPRADLEKALRADYTAMQEMFFVQPPTFDEVLEELRRLEDEINAIPA